MKVTTMQPVTMDVSVAQIAAYLRRTGWTIVDPGYFGPGHGGRLPIWSNEGVEIPFDEGQPDDDVTAQHFVQHVLHKVAEHERRGPHETLRDISGVGA